jgi:hypothetical protein
MESKIANARRGGGGNFSCPEIDHDLAADCPKRGRKIHSYRGGRSDDTIIKRLRDFSEIAVMTPTQFITEVE